MTSPLSRVLLVSVIALGLTVSASAQSQMACNHSTTSSSTVPHHPDLVPLAGITVEAWVYHDIGVTVGWNTPSICRKGTGPESYILRTTAHPESPAEWVVRTVGGGLQAVTTPVNLPMNTWVHLAATYDNAIARIFFNGVEVAAQPLSGGPLAMSTTAFQMGHGGGPGEVWNGCIDELRIWNRALNAAEIQSTMGLRIEAGVGLVAAWHFDGDFDDTVGGHHATAVGGISLQPSTSPVQGLHLHAASTSPIGNPIGYVITSDFPQTPYLFDVSVSGNSPGVSIPGVGVVPLNPPFLNLAFGSQNPSFFTAFTGATDLFGGALPTLTIPDLPALIGTDVHAAFVFLDPLAPTGVGQIGNGVLTTLTDHLPAITGVTPATSPQSGGVPLTITGDNFQTGASVTIGGVAPGFSYVVDAQTIAVLTAPGVLGPADVEVVNPDGNAVTLLGGITYVEDLVLSGVSPLHPLPGEPVVVTGSGIDPAGLFEVAGASVIANLTPANVSFNAPVFLPCDALIRMTNPDGQTATLTINPSPVISDLLPSSGPAAGGNQVFMLGDHFHGVVAVTVDGIPAIVNASTQQGALLTMPPRPAGPATLTLTNASGCSATATYLYQ